MDVDLISRLTSHNSRLKKQNWAMRKILRKTLALYPESSLALEIKAYLDSEPDRQDQHKS
jgi:hypothetical protein